MDEHQTPSKAPSGAAPLAPSPRGLEPWRGGLVVSAWRVPLIRQLTRFTGVGIVCTATSLVLYALCRPWLGAQLANAVALIATSVMNTDLNRRFTFRITDRRGLAQDHLNGLVAMGVALLLTSGSLWILLWANPTAGVAVELWTTTVAGWVATAVRFSLLRHWIFRRARNA